MGRHPFDVIEKNIFDKSWTHEASLVIKYHDLLQSFEKAKESFQEHIEAAFEAGKSESSSELTATQYYENEYTSPKRYARIPQSDT